MRRFFTFYILLLAVPAFGTNYYIDKATGNDSNPGTIGLPFKTISKGVSSVSAPGDSVFIAPGFYRERVSIINGINGTIQNPITVKRYGVGAVVIDGSAAVTSWTNISGEIYKSTPGFAVRAVVIDNTPLYPVAPLGTAEECAAPYNTYAGTSGLWQEGRYLYESSTGDLYVWAPGGGNPSSHSELGVINAAHGTSLVTVYLWGTNNWTFDGLTLQFGDAGLNQLSGTGITLKNSIVRFNNYAGAAGVHTLTNNLIYYNVMTNWPRGRYPWIWGSWPGSVSLDPNGGLADNNAIFMNGGEGILAYNSTGTGGAVFQNNTVGNNWSVQIYADNFKNPVIKNNFVYSTPDNVWKTNNGQSANDYDISKRLRGTGIQLANEDYNAGCHLDNALIINNIVVGARMGFGYAAEGACGTVGLQNTKVYNNTFIVPNSRQPYLSDGNSTDNYKGFYYYWVDNTVGNEFRNNIIYASDAWSWAIVHVGNAAVYSGFTFDHNLIFHYSRSNNIYWNSPMTYNTWLSLSGPSHGTGDVTSDPKLVAPYGFTVGSYNFIDATSPAIDAGMQLSVANDFVGTTRPQGVAFDIGAYEYLVSGSKIPNPPSLLIIR